MARRTKSLGARSVATIVVLAGAALTGMLAPGYAGARTVAIVNGTRTAMVSLQTREAKSGAWQVDVLNHRTLGIQKQILVPLSPGSACFFDIKAVFEDGHRVTKTHVNLCASASYVLTEF